MHKPEFSPTSEILNNYKQNKINWQEYEKMFNELLMKRKIERAITKLDLDMACLLCSESTADKCHRRLVAEYLKRKLNDIEIVHL